jgi:RNA polymerase sigma-70 factor (ECF subfamily)
MTASAAQGADNSPDFSQLYTAILKLRARHQTIITLRFFENLRYEQIAQILNIKEATLRVGMHRIINELRNHLQTVIDGEA